MSDIRMTKSRKKEWDFCFSGDSSIAHIHIPRDEAETGRPGWLGEMSTASTQGESGARSPGVMRWNEGENGTSVR